jgi:hypothetical protein
MAGTYVDGVVVNVSAELDYFKTHADSSINSSHAFASQLATQYTFSSDEVSYSPISTSTIELEKLVKPTAPTVSFAGIVEPSSPHYNPVAIQPTTAPAYSVSSLPINIPLAPGGLDILVPVRDFSLDFNVDIPVSPGYELPSVPTMDSYNLPKIAPTLSTINFTQNLPTLSAIVPPANVFNFNTSPFNSSVSTQVKDVLLARLTGGTGLNPVVEEALWARGSDRELKASLLAQETLLNDRAGAGFSRPNGAMLAALDNIVMESQSKIIELSREIAIKQAELEQANIKESIGQALTLEDLLLKTYIDNSTRALEVAKYTQELSIELFKADVSVNTLEIEAYKAFTSAYEAKVRAELNKLEKFKSELDAEKLKGESNEQKIKLYLAKLDGIKTNVELYKTNIDAVNSKLQAETLKLNAFSEDIKNYSAQVEAKNIEFTMYSTKVAAEKLKSEITQNQIQGYATRVQAYASEVDAKSKIADVAIKANEFNLKQFETNVDAYIKKLESRRLTYQAAIDVYKGEAELYRSDIDYQKSKVDIYQKKIDSDIANASNSFNVAALNAKLKLDALTAGTNTTLEGRKAAGSIHQALAQASLSAVNVSMGASAQVANYLNENHSFNT